ncbi:MAG: tetratricopeptide repeat protein [Gammaproteobacteria bacterium]|nr:tetratricopeptide repeat protein [Gammaproteobacteria bacterium]MBT8112021.1 tetratricopeptide repeat protein [Gammaproteobacteria bacterium]NND48114.1 tetratricopeptide repeat protein [Woeseiaceae bacterium]NNL46722.1 tetratricopeptide repeat protein [Woeseiaceae bacterium]
MKQRIKDLIGELRSRSVFRATVAYCVVTWMLLQVADVTFDRLPIPEGSMTVLIILAVIGLPCTIVLAWAYEITLRGVVRHEQANGRSSRLAFLPFVVVLVAVTAAVGSGLYYLSLRIWQPEPQAIAVLPLTNLSNSQDTEYFSDGLTQEIRSLIVRLDEFRVVSLSSTYQLKDTALDYRTIAKRLDVDVILHGSVNRAQDRVRITAELIDGDDGTQLWSETFDSELANLFSIQERIARKVAAALDIVVPVSVERRLAHLGTQNVEAYDLYLRGTDYLRKPKDIANLSTARTYIRQAIAIDPQFGKAYAAMCQSHLSLYELERDSDQFAQAERACYRALTRDSAASDMRIALGQLYYTSGQYDESLREFEQAAAVNSKSPDAQIGMAQSLIKLNREAEAEASLQRAIQLDSSYYGGFNAMGNFLLANGRFAEAARYYRDFADRSEDNATAFNNLGAAYYLAGNLSAAAEAWDKSLAIKPSRSAFSNTGTMYFYLGDYAKAADRFARGSNYAPRDHRLWGNLADTYYYTDGMRHVADVIYKQAIEFAEDRTSINPSDMDTVAMLAHFYARTGWADKARELSEAAQVGAPDDMYVQYYNALVYAHLGDTDKALDRLKRAIELDYQKELLKLDPGLGSLWEDDRFKRLVSKN